MVWSECSSGRSVTTYVDSFDRETTRVPTFTLLNSVIRAFGISSANRRSSSGDGFQLTDFGSTGSDFVVRFTAGRPVCGVAAVGVGRISVMQLSSSIVDLYCGSKDGTQGERREPRF